MSSNGFARSRSRVRHQRVPKTQCYVHPRFLQLVKELARLDEIKKKQDEIEHSDESLNSSTIRNLVIGCPTGTACLTTEEASVATSSNPHHSLSHHRSHHHHNQHQHQHHHHHSQHQQRSVTDSWPANASIGAANCCSSVNEAHSSNGCRSLDCNRSTLALNDSYYRQNSGSDGPHMANHNLQHHQSYHQQRQYNYTHQNPIDQPASNMGQSHNLPSDYRFPNKCSSSSSASSAAHINLGCSKTGFIVQNNPDLSISESDPRQDENRSKRKRSTIDLSSTSKKISPSLSPTSCTKRHKSSPEPVRPLSPSFTKCPICLLDCMDRDPSFTNTCFHLFCFVCIESWSKSKATCPLCRTKFTKIVYNIRSASCFDEKVASPIRRDDDDDRSIYEQLNGLSTGTLGSSRTSNSEETRLLFDNLRNNDGLIPQFGALLNHSLSRQMSAIHSLNSVTTNSNFNSSVPQTPFTAANYNNPLATHYIALLNDRSQPANGGPAISSAYATNTSSNVINSDSGNRLTRMSRRYPPTRFHDLAPIDGAARISRSTSTDLNQTGISLEPRQHHHHHHQLQHGTHHQHHGQHNQHPPQQNQQQQHRSTMAALELGSARQSQRMEMHSHILNYPIQRGQYTNPNVYSRRPYTNAPVEQHLLDNFYRQMPDI